MNASAEGLYEFADLSAGEYKIKFEAGGFEMKEIERIQIGRAHEVRRDVQLGIQQVGEVVQVGGEDNVNRTSPWVLLPLRRQPSNEIRLFLQS